MEKNTARSRVVAQVSNLLDLIIKQSPDREERVEARRLRGLVNRKGKKNHE